MEFPFELSLSPDRCSAVLCSLSTLYLMKVVFGSLDPEVQCENGRDWDVVCQEGLMITADESIRRRGDIHILWLDSTTCLLSNRYNSTIIVLN